MASNDPVQPEQIQQPANHNQAPAWTMEVLHRIETLKARSPLGSDRAMANRPPDMDFPPYLAFVDALPGLEKDFYNSFLPEVEHRRFLADGPYEKWCINQGVNLTFEKYAIRFGCTDKQKAYRRYAEIVHHVAEGALKEKLVCDFANWKDSLQQHQFWLDRTLVKQSLKARKEGTNVLGTNIRRAAADIKGLGKRKAQGEVDESEDLRRNMLNRAEHDGVFVELLGKSVGTIIKQEALKIYGVWAHGDELTPYGRKNMCLKPLALPDTVAETLKIISAICLESCHAKDALEYIHHILATPLEEKERNLLRILEEM
ncbi:hypothetical protein BX666DRAFT_1874855 [Dichotomocladium elegans]|nr:hypothetical protein BX666DRAFT_1874855 [Dichotomocladium elegans]